MATSVVPCFFTTPMKGFGFFKSKPRTPDYLPHHLRDLLLYSAPNSAVRKTKREEKICELRKVIIQMMTLLYGNDGLQPAAEETCVKLTVGFFKEDTFRVLITSLPYLDSGIRQDITYVIKNLNRQRVNGRYVASEYLMCNTDLLDMLVIGCDDLELELSYGAILRECIRHQVVAKYILESDHIKNFFKYVQDPHFEIASDVATTFRELLTRHKSTVAEFLSKNYDWFFQEYNSLLESSNYITRRNSLNLLGVILFDQSNISVMVRYVCSLENMRIVMNLLRDSNKTIQVEAFHVFKLFPANQKKPPEIANVLVANRSKLIRFFSDFSFEKADEKFESDKAQVVEEISTLKCEPSSTLMA